MFTPKIGEDSHFDEHIFQKGWFNHQLVTRIPIKQPVFYASSIRPGFFGTWLTSGSAHSKKTTQKPTQKVPWLGPNFGMATVWSGVCAGRTQVVAGGVVSAGWLSRRLYLLPMAWLFATVILSI